MSFKVNQVDQDFLDGKLRKDSKSKKFPKVFKIKVDISKVNMKVMKNWITAELDKILKDDDIVVDYLYELLVAGNEPNIKQIHLQMIDFLGEEESLTFCKKLWELLIGGSQDEGGIAKELIEEKRKEIVKGRGRDRDVRSVGEGNAKHATEKDSVETTPEPRKRTNYNRSANSNSNRTRSPERRLKTNYRERDYRESF